MEKFVQKYFSEVLSHKHIFWKSIFRYFSGVSISYYCDRYDLLHSDSVDRPLGRTQTLKKVVSLRIHRYVDGATTLQRTQDAIISRRRRGAVGRDATRRDDDDTGYIFKRWAPTDICRGSSRASITDRAQPTIPRVSPPPFATSATRIHDDDVDRKNGFSANRRRRISARVRPPRKRTNGYSRTVDRKRTERRHWRTREQGRKRADARTGDRYDGRATGDTRCVGLLER